MGVLSFIGKCVIPELYESYWCVIGDLTGASHNNSIKFINFNTPGSSLNRKIIEI